MHHRERVWTSNMETVLISEPEWLCFSASACTDNICDPEKDRFISGPSPCPILATEAGWKAAATEALASEARGSGPREPAPTSSGVSLPSGCPAAARRARFPARMLLRLICLSGGGPPRGWPRTMMAQPERTWRGKKTGIRSSKRTKGLPCSLTGPVPQEAPTEICLKLRQTGRGNLPPPPRKLSLKRGARSMGNLQNTVPGYSEKFSCSSDPALRWSRGRRERSWVWGTFHLQVDPLCMTSFLLSVQGHGPLSWIQQSPPVPLCHSAIPAESPITRQNRSCVEAHIRQPGSQVECFSYQKLF